MNMFSKHVRSCSFLLFDPGLCEFFLQPPEELVPVLVLLLSVAPEIGNSLSLCNKFSERESISTVVLITPAYHRALEIITPLPLEF